MNNAERGMCSESSSTQPQAERARLGGAGPGAEGRNLDHFAIQIAPFDEAVIRADLAAHGVAAGASSRRSPSITRAVSGICSSTSLQRTKSKLFSGKCDRVTSSVTRRRFG